MAVTRHLYRSLIRWTNEPLVRRSRFCVMNKDVEHMLLGRSPGFERAQSAADLRALVRRCFRASRDATGTELDAALDAGFVALRLAPTLTEELEVLQRQRLANTRKEAHNVQFGVGQVVRHKRLGYRAVIFGWDVQCTCSEEWMAARQVEDGAQPFFYALLDRSDAEAVFGRARDAEYVAQSEVELVTEVEDARVCNHLMGHYFRAFAPSRIRFAPNDFLAYEYPADCADWALVEGGEAGEAGEEPLPGIGAAVEQRGATTAAAAATAAAAGQHEV